VGTASRSEAKGAVKEVSFIDGLKTSATAPWTILSSSATADRRQPLVRRTGNGR
jgi:hypothetical protein